MMKMRLDKKKLNKHYFAVLNYMQQGNLIMYLKLCRSYKIYRKHVIPLII